MSDLRMRTHQLVLIIGLACSSSAPWLWAQEEPAERGGIRLSVEPGGLLIQHVKPGETYDLTQSSGIALKISNTDTKPRTYRLSTHRPSEVGNRKWLEGYLEILDPSWFWLEQGEVTVGPESDGFVKMYLKIPEEEQYHNQHWVVSVGVQGKPEAGEMLALAAFPRYQIETESKADVKAIPAGLLGIKPAMLQFETMEPGKRKKAQVSLYNNDATARMYTISVKTILVDPTREQIVPSPGYAWIPEPKWMSVSKGWVKVNGNESRTVNVSVKVPNKPEYSGQRWEALLWVEPDEGLPRFARIQIETQPVLPSQ